MRWCRYVVGWLLALDRGVFDYRAQQVRGPTGDAGLPERNFRGARAVVLGTGPFGARVAERLTQFGIGGEP